ncbi:Cytoplasmic polyadenylation element-binding protein 4 [Thelohanellus kitauei]|uniref:Cytoplasmic polyadenylation element-binding protein 4 n=1 Tax=Thelohanellus kitauei TaxID=669202 RepID=A0A0C2MZC7_THEKT|nr:Cytoplasmic polyadenylation element-binding protein 4 [Thelohanellus kitauei]
MAYEIEMTNYSLFSERIALPKNNVLRIPSHSYLPSSSSDVISSSTDEHGDSLATHASDCESWPIDDESIPRNAPKCFGQLTNCSSRLTDLQISKIQNRPIDMSTPTIPSSRSITPPPVRCKVTSAPESFHRTESHRIGHFSDKPINSNGLILPIDDNEFAIIDPSLDKEGLTYEVFTNSVVYIDNLKINRPFTHQRSASLNSEIFLNSLTPNNSFYRPRSENIRPSGGRSRGNSPDMRTSSPDSQNMVGSFTYDSESDQSFVYGDNFSKNDSKDKPNSVFDCHGLFIKHDHPLFTQTFSRKVFIGGLPRDISIDNIQKRFSVFGSLHVDWPNRDQEKSPPNGFAFLHFDHASSVEKLFEAVSNNRNKNKFSMSSHTVRAKDVEVKFWRMNDCECSMIEDRDNINPFLTVFVGALPRTTTASELAGFMDSAFSSVAYAAIDVDVIYGYPKGAGRVTFLTTEAFIQALSSHYVDMEIGHCGKKKRIEIKPFLANDQTCDTCSIPRNTQTINKYCYCCQSFVCDGCECRPCMVGGSHKLVSRPTIDISSFSSD